MAKLSNYNIGICLLVATGGFSYGFGTGSFPASTGQLGFYTYYNLDPSSSCESSWRSSWALVSCCDDVLTPCAR